MQPEKYPAGPGPGSLLMGGNSTSPKVLSTKASTGERTGGKSGGEITWQDISSSIPSIIMSFMFPPGFLIVKLPIRIQLAAIREGWV